MLVWIKSALSPQEIRDRISSPDSVFQNAMVDYLESTHVGQFLTGSMEQIKAKVPHLSRRSKGIHDIVEDDDVGGYPVGYSDPTQVLPVAPPTQCDCNRSNCTKCISLKNWRRHYVETVDDLMLRSNVHSWRSPVAGTDLSKFQKPGTKIKLEVKGCTRSDGSCSARFPRDIHLNTEVDLNDGSIKLRKLEPMLNNVTPAVTYVLGCNTDVTCLLSGTSIKAVVAFILIMLRNLVLKHITCFNQCRTYLTATRCV
ncbi:hypothetical protein C8J57DRAFT_1076227 [Mycena rebaudengoi]|nr:hypothetical protein C8J57DRAFT_1076227 [Mycena rebaudengoi]